MEFTKEQIEYVQSEINRGITEDDIKSKLLKHNYTEEQVSGLFEVVQKQSSASNTKIPENVTATLVSSVTTTHNKIKKMIIIIVLLSVAAVGIWFGLYIALNKFVDNKVTSVKEASGQFTESVEKMVYMRTLIQNVETFKKINDSYEGFCNENTDASVECAEGVDSVRISSTFLEGGIFCFDSNGYEGEVKSLPSKAVCAESASTTDSSATPVVPVSSTPNVEETVPNVTMESPQKKKETLLLSVGRVPDTGVYKINANDKNFQDIPFKLNTYISDVDLGKYNMCFTLMENGKRSSRTNCSSMSENVVADTGITLNMLSLTPFPVDKPYYSIGQHRIELIVALISSSAEVSSKIISDTSDALSVLYKNALALESTGVFTAEATSIDEVTSAKIKGRDAVTKSTLTNSRMQAELYYDVDGSYKNYCISDSVVQSSIAAINADCADSDTAYRLNALLSDGMYYCVDSTGRADTYQNKASGLSCQ